MAGGIDWFRWHHGSVTDPKFQLIASKADARLGDVLVVWACLLESASANVERGTFSEPDLETLDFLIGAGDGVAARIIEAMRMRKLIDGCRIVRWEIRQPKRERDPAPPPPDALPPMSSAERSRAHRARMASNAPSYAMQRHATPSSASNGNETPREEESREEKGRIPPIPPARVNVVVASFMQPAAVCLIPANVSERRSHVRG